MANIPIEQPPVGTDDMLTEYLTRMFINTDIALRKDNYFVPQYVMPDKLQVGRTYFFGDAILPDIDQEGLWVYKSTGWSYLG